MKILLANANTTQDITDRVVAEARHHAAPGTEIVGATASFGVAIISTDAENAVASHAMLGLLARHPDVDAAVLATSFDTGMAGAQAVMPYPVIGMTVAAIHGACLLARRFGLITFGGGSRGMYLDLVQSSGLAGRMAGCHTVELTSTAAYFNVDTLDRLVAAAAAGLAQEGAGAVVIAGAATAGMSRRIHKLSPVPLLDGIATAVRMAELMVGLGLRPMRTVPLQQSRSPIGLDPALAALLGGS